MTDPKAYQKMAQAHNPYGDGKATEKKEQERPGSHYRSEPECPSIQEHRCIDERQISPGESPVAAFERNPSAESHAGRT